jgi:hypothetical protein
MNSALGIDPIFIALAINANRTWRSIRPAIGISTLSMCGAGARCDQQKKQLCRPTDCATDL